jgi:hypothetical protein
MNIFQASWENIFQEFSKMPNFKPLKKLKNLIVNLSANFFKILSQNNKKILIWGLSARPKC